jgi:glycine cleavage system H protein
VNVPAQLKYTATHEWARLDADGLVAVGITDHAQDALGDIVFLELPEIGRQVEAKEEVAVVESVKAASDIYAPVDGEIVAINQEVAESPQSVNEDAYSAWLFKIKPGNASDLARLLDAAAYRKVAEADSH